MSEEKEQTVEPQQKKPEPVELTPEQKVERNLAFDKVLTWGLIFVGIYTVFTGLADYINPRPVMNALYEELNVIVPGLELQPFQNIDLAVTMGWVAVTIQAIVLALVVWYSQQRMKAKKFSWWVPVVGAIVANVLSTACIAVAMVGDPSFQEAIRQFTAQAN